MRKNKMDDGSPQVHEATWHRRIPPHPEGALLAPPEESRPLYRRALDVTGCYLAGLIGAGQKQIQFPYSVREEQRGFLKIDIGFEILVVCCDSHEGPVDRFMAVVERAHYFASMVAGDASSGLFVPIIVFGEQRPHLFYIESLRGLGNVDPFFVEAAHEFIARRLLPRYVQPAGISDYLDSLRAGRDDKEILAREPLVNALLRGAPPQTHVAMMSQIADDLDRRIGAQGRAGVLTTE